MRIPTASFALTAYTANKIEKWSSPEQSIVKRHLATRVAAAASAVLSLIDSAVHAIFTAVKLPFAITKGTVGRLSLPFVGKLNERMSDSLGMTEVLRHAGKTALFAISSVASPLGAIFSPAALVNAQKLFGLVPTNTPTTHPAPPPPKASSVEETTSEKIASDDETESEPISTRVETDSEEDRDITSWDTTESSSPLEEAEEDSDITFEAPPIVEPSRLDQAAHIFNDAVDAVSVVVQPVWGLIEQMRTTLSFGN